jgi:aspartyl-tRNA(Asn)/glutamyl-tRNA(Gln) amidotransferase subunit C
MELNREMTLKLAALARLEFTDQELAGIQADLQQMIGFVEKLNELDTSGVEPLTHISGEENRLRNDEIKGSVSPTLALSNAPAPAGHFFTVPKVIKK